MRFLGVDGRGERDMLKGRVLARDDVFRWDRCWGKEKQESDRDVGRIKGLKTGRLQAKTRKDGGE